MRIFGRKFDDKKVKKNVYTAVLVALIIWFVYRFIMVAIESRMTVFNPVRDAGQNGTPIETGRGVCAPNCARDKKSRAGGQLRMYQILLILIRGCMLCKRVAQTMVCKMFRFHAVDILFRYMPCVGNL